MLTAAKAGSDVRTAHRAFEDARKEAQGIAGVLASLHAELQKAKDDLHHLVDVEAKERGLHVNAVGVVIPRIDFSKGIGTAYDPDGQILIRERQQACDAFARRIDHVLQRATHADETACWALRRDLGTSRSNFNAKVVTSLADANAVRAGELKRNARTKADGWSVEGKADASGLDVGTSASGPDTGAGALGEAEAHADLGRASAEGALTNGAFKLAGETEAYAGAKVSLSSGSSNEGIHAGAGGFAGGEASAKGSAYLGPVGVHGRADGLAGVEASTTASAGREGLVLGTEAFAGAKGSATGGADIGGIAAGATAEGWAGIGAEAEVTLGKSADGKWEIGTRTGLACGLGGSVGFEFTVDPEKVGDTAGDIADGLGRLF
ncbi:hypothetical protein [Streptomyces sp. SID13726]|uniref:hypothetical protein n=1 Tax=Streptomyces sp. SID13726 TaxID=2706058 RepID=UPI0013BBA039|nr:hypothetical protein [Streptomyces sp. SID13726]NEB06192.1 hypothetical protein [Streptomyces sp. SID13726]